MIQYHIQYNLKDLNDEEIIGSFYDRQLQKSIL